MNVRIPDLISSSRALGLVDGLAIGEVEGRAVVPESSVQFYEEEEVRGFGDLHGLSTALGEGGARGGGHFLIASPNTYSITGTLTLFGLSVKRAPLRIISGCT